MQAEAAGDFHWAFCPFSYSLIARILLRLLTGIYSDLTCGGGSLFARRQIKKKHCDLCGLSLFYSPIHCIKMASLSELVAV
jgi:hypothetical protein